MARPRQFDEDGVLLAVRDQFWDAGYAATSLQDLMRVSGLGKGSLYAAFGDKHRLFVRALDEYVRVSHEALRRLLTETPRAIDALRAFVAAPVDDRTGAAARRGCLLANSTCELATSDPGAATLVRRAYDTTVALVRDCVARAQRERDVAADVDPAELARMLLVAQQGVVLLGRSGMDIQQLTRTAESLATRLLPAR